MTTPATVSVVVPCFNAARYVDEAICSIRKQTYGALDIIAINDGSTDETQRLLERHAENDRRVRVFSQPNRGLPAARNAGLQNARGEFVSFLDADDVILPEKIEKQTKYLCEHPAIDLVYSDYYTGDSHLELTGLVVVRIPGTDLMDAYARRNWFACMVPLVRRRMIDAVGEFDETLRSAEDFDYWIRCAKVGSFGYLAGPVAIYRSHESQMHNHHERMFAGGKRVIDKHFRSDPRRYRQALAAFYEANARYRWAAKDRLKTGLYLALSAYHESMGAVVTQRVGR